MHKSGTETNLHGEKSLITAGRCCAGDGLYLSSPKCVLCEVISFREYSLVKEENEQLYSEEN